MLDNLNLDESSLHSQQNEKHRLFELDSLITVITAKRMTLKVAFIRALIRLSDTILISLNCSMSLIVVTASSARLSSRQYH